jgi:hypothetical protein
MVRLVPGVVVMLAPLCRERSALEARVLRAVRALFEPVAVLSSI